MKNCGRVTIYVGNNFSQNDLTKGNYQAHALKVGDTIAQDSTSPLYLVGWNIDNPHEDDGENQDYCEDLLYCKYNVDTEVID